MNNPKKLIRDKIIDKLIPDEWETISNQDELNQLYAIKVREELAEIQQSDHKDIMEFVDLMDVAYAFAKQNGFTQDQITAARLEKLKEKGIFGRLALNNLNPENPSNKMYFPDESFEDAKTFANKYYQLENSSINVVTIKSAVRFAQRFHEHQLNKAK